MDELRKKMRDIHDEVPPDYYDRSVEENLFQRYWHSRRIAVISTLLSGEAGRLLDIGCGGGFLLERFGKGIKWSAGVDAAFESIRYASATRKGPRFLCADFYELPFKDSTFDAATAIEVLEHLHNPEDALKELNRCLKRGGRIIIVVPNENNLLFRLIWYFWTKGKGRIWKEAHVQKFTEKSLASLLEGSGFRVVRTRMFILGMLMAMKAEKA